LKLVKRSNQPVTRELIIETYRKRRTAIRRRLKDFRLVKLESNDERFWEEMVYCFFTGGCSAKMGLRAVDAVRPLLIAGSREELAAALKGVHRYPNARSRYVVESREYIRSRLGFRLSETLESFNCPLERRDWLVREPGIKGLGYKEASHFLRNVGYRGYAILDKHVLRCLKDLGVIDNDKPPATRLRYLQTEEKLRQLAKDLSIGFDELDLVLWSVKTGEILK
jgi:N-glycosylase/DNA lyase